MFFKKRDRMRAGSLYIIFLGLLIITTSLTTILLKQNKTEPVFEEEYLLPQRESEALETHKNKVYGRVAIVIDDCGSIREYEDDFLAISKEITYAILPDTERAKEFSDKANTLGIETIIHVPMEPLNVDEVIMEKRAIYLSNSGSEISDILNEFFLEFPNAKGINNHMGSAATSSEHCAENIALFCKSRGLYILDSYTVASSKLNYYSKALSVKGLKRDVFLDNTAETEAIEKQIEKLCEESIRKGFAVGIGHYQHRETFLALKKQVPLLEKKGVKLVRLSELIYDENIRN